MEKNAYLKASAVNKEGRKETAYKMGVETNLKG